MEITYKSPASINIIPIPGSIVKCRFKLKANPSRVRVDIAAHIYWRKNIKSTDVECSNIGKIYTENIDKIHEVNLVIPQYDITKRISSGVMIYLQDPYSTKAIVENISFNIDTNTPLISGKIINFYQKVVRQSGYGILGNSIYQGFLRRKDWHINNILNTYNIGINKSKITLILGVPSGFFKSPTSKITIGYTMFETINKIPMSWIPGCNTIDRIFVPIKSNIYSFKSCGVKKPIDHVPIGIDPIIYDPTKIGKNFNFPSIVQKAYKFLIINDNQPRKNNRMIIKAIGEEFSEEIKKKEVVLVTRLCYGKKQIKESYVYHIKRYLEDSEMPLLINSCDCMVNVSSGECGDIPILQGMAMEKPVVISDDKLLHTEIIEDSHSEYGQTGFLVDIKRYEEAYTNPRYATAKFSYMASLNNSQWIVPDIIDLKRKLRYVYDNRNSDEIKQIGKNARRYILDDRTVDISVNKMINIFDNI